MVWLTAPFCPEARTRYQSRQDTVAVDPGPPTVVARQMHHFDKTFSSMTAIKVHLMEYLETTCQILLISISGFMKEDSIKSGGCVVKMTLTSVNTV